MLKNLLRGITFFKLPTTTLKQFYVLSVGSFSYILVALIEGQNWKRFKVEWQAVTGPTFRNHHRLGKPFFNLAGDVRFLAIRNNCNFHNLHADGIPKQIPK